MRIRVFCEALISLAVSLSIARADECLFVPEVKFGRVEAAVADFSGASIDNADIELVDLAGENVIRFRGSADKVPYGRYILRVARSGFSLSEQFVTVEKPETVLRVTLLLPRSCGQPWPGVYGAIKPVQGEGSMWVKLVPARGVGSHETRARFGYFAMPDIDPGDYFLLVADGNRILHTRSITVGQTRDVILRLDLTSR